MRLCAPPETACKTDAEGERRLSHKSASSTSHAVSKLYLEEVCGTRFELLSERREVAVSRWKGSVYGSTG